MPADSGRGNEEGSWVRALRLSEPLLWLWVAAILYLGSSFSIHRDCVGLPVGRLGRICWCCAPARWSYRVRDCRSHLVISRSHLRPLQLPAETFEELLLWFTNKQQQGFRIILSRLVVRVGVVVINGLWGHIGATQRVTLHSLGRWHLVSEVPTEEEAPGFDRSSVGSWSSS